MIYKSPRTRCATPNSSALLASGIDFVFCGSSMSIGAMGAETLISKKHKTKLIINSTAPPKNDAIGILLPKLNGYEE